MPCQPTIRSSAASFLANPAAGRRMRKRSASSASRSHLFSRAKAQTASAAALWAPKLFNQAGGDSLTHLVVNRSSVFAAKAKSFEKALTDRRDIDAEFAHAVVNDRRAKRRMLGSFILDNLQRPNAGTLLAPRAQKQAAIACRSKQDGARCRQVGLEDKDTLQCEPHA